MCGSERLTGAWLKAILASILAKGDSADQNSYGGESLLSVQRGKEKPLQKSQLADQSQF